MLTPITVEDIIEGFVNPGTKGFQGLCPTRPVARGVFVIGFVFGNTPLTNLSRGFPLPGPKSDLF